MQHAAVNTPVLVEEKVSGMEYIRFESFEQSDQGMVIEKDGAKDRAFGVYILRERFFGFVTRGHLGSALTLRRKSEGPESAEPD